MGKLNLYILFHLNINYSSIAENKRGEIIKKCYWPILEIIEEMDIPVAVEIPVNCLETVKSIDPGWVSKFKALLKEGRCELIGSGYMQIIGPLVPALVNAHNQRLGLHLYKKILGYKPRVALVNEQAYSSGLISHYKNSGYDAVIMEWNNPYQYHPQWDKKWRYYPQKIEDNYGNSIDVIWNDAIVFQKFQRYAHGEMETDEYISYLKQHLCAKENRTLCLYSNDAEIFDFRPGRFMTEANIHSDGEWNRIREFLDCLKRDSAFNFILPSNILNVRKSKLAWNNLALESSPCPIPVKKQSKYNITRWALTGKNDCLINTLCYRIYSVLKNFKKKSGQDKFWKKLCYLWGSDFRTHIEEKRWKRYLEELNNFDKQLKTCKREAGSKPIRLNPDFDHSIVDAGKMICVETNNINIVLNKHKGMAIESLTFKNISSKPLVKTLSHGYYDDMNFGADYFSAHTIIEEGTGRKVTDLEPVTANVCVCDDVLGKYVGISSSMKNKYGCIGKRINIYWDSIFIVYDLDLQLDCLSSLRTGIITFSPEAFDTGKLYYKTTNGGYREELFDLGKEKNIAHNESVNKLISASHCLGATDGWIEIGDDKKHIRIQTDKTNMYSVPMIEFHKFDRTYFLRVYNSLKEVDDTCLGNRNLVGKIGFQITAGKK